MEKGTTNGTLREYKSYRRFKLLLEKHLKRSAKDILLKLVMEGVDTLEKFLKKELKGIFEGEALRSVESLRGTLKREVCIFLKISEKQLYSPNKKKVEYKLYDKRFVLFIGSKDLSERGAKLFSSFKFSSLNDLSRKSIESALSEFKEKVQREKSEKKLALVIFSLETIEREGSTFLIPPGMKNTIVPDHLLNQQALNLEQIILDFSRLNCLHTVFLFDSPIHKVVMDT